MCECIPGAESTCSGSNVGECRSGSKTCKSDGTWGPCTGVVGPTAEICNDGKDNNCDGQVDEGCECSPGQTQSCGGTSTVGACHPGTQACDSTGHWGPCQGAQGPTKEVCDGIDNNCDGNIDEGITQVCFSQCGAGTQVCQNGSFTPCNAQTPMAEICDGVDNDCNGFVDEGCDCTPGKTQVCGGSSSMSGSTSSCGSGTQTCDQNGHWGPCQGSFQSGPEVCDGIDNDCNGLIDDPKGENFSLCPPGEDCVNGKCTPYKPSSESQNDDTPDPAGQPKGCACDLGGGRAGAGGPLAFPLLALCLAHLTRRRRID
jgi:hypothetical protein